MTFRFTTLSLRGIKKERVQKMSDYTPSQLLLRCAQGDAVVGKSRPLLRCAHGDGIFFVSTNGVPTRINYHRQFEYYDFVKLLGEFFSFPEYTPDRNQHRDSTLNIRFG